MTCQSAMDERSAVDAIANIHIAEDILSSADLKSRANNNETLMYRYYIKLYAMSKLITEEKMTKKSFDSLQLLLECLNDYVKFLVHESELAEIKDHQNLINLVSEMIGWFRYLQRKLELHLASRRESTNHSKVSNFVYCADSSVNVVDLMDDKPDEVIVPDADLSVNVVDLMDDKADKVVDADMFKQFDHRVLEELKCDNVIDKYVTNSYICIHVFFSDELKFEIVHMFFSVLNLKSIELAMIVFNMLIYKCQRSLDCIILLPEFTGILDGHFLFFCSGIQPESEILTWNELLPGRGVLYNSRTHLELMTND